MGRLKRLRRAFIPSAQVREILARQRRFLPEQFEHHAFFRRRFEFDLPVAFLRPLVVAREHLFHSRFLPPQLSQHFRRPVVSQIRVLDELARERVFRGGCRCPGRCRRILDGSRLLVPSSSKSSYNTLFVVVGEGKSNARGFYDSFFPVFFSIFCLLLCKSLFE